jgi:hypothetical protein
MVNPKNSLPMFILENEMRAHRRRERNSYENPQSTYTVWRLQRWANPRMRERKNFIDQSWCHDYSWAKAIHIVLVIFNHSLTTLTLYILSNAHSVRRDDVEIEGEMALKLNLIIFKGKCWKNFCLKFKNNILNFHYLTIPFRFSKIT